MTELMEQLESLKKENENLKAKKDEYLVGKQN